MTTTNTMNGCTTTNGSRAALERTRYFQRQMLTPADMTQDQIYFLEKLRRHNRFLHGWGVVCGVRVMLDDEDPCKLTVEPGYVLGPYGDEIYIDQLVTIDVCKEDINGNALSGCGVEGDPWCSNIRVKRQAGQTLYLAVRYSECHTQPVRSYANGCGCEETNCEYSRTRDSYDLKLLSRLPSTYPEEMSLPPLAEAVQCIDRGDNECQGRPCLPCPEEPWVILADITIGNDGNIGSIDCFAHRRYVASFGNYFFVCDADRTLVAGKAISEEKVAYAPTRVRTMSMVNRTSEAPPGQPSAYVRAEDAAGEAVYVPVDFEVEAGERVADFLEREGGREYLEPSSGEIITLRELYALVDLPADTVLAGTGSALASLEGVSLRVNELRAARRTLDSELDNVGLEKLDKERAGAPAAAAELPATAIRGVGPTSTLGKKVAKLTVAEVAGQSEEKFVEMATKGVAKNRRTAVTNQATEVWKLARKILVTSERFKG